jgi:hypothetical protein
MNTKGTITVVAIVLLGIGTALAQQVNIVHYGANEKGKSGRPDLSKAVVGIQLTGESAATAKDLLLKLGAGINETSTPCTANQNLICVMAHVGPGQFASGYGSSSSYGSRGGSYGSGGFSGTFYPVVVDVVLVKYSDGARTSIVLGEAQVKASEGSGYESTSGYGGGGGGTFTSGGTTTLAGTYDNAVNKALTSLLSKHLLARFLAKGEYAHWYKGGSLVQEAFQ